MGGQAAARGADRRSAVIAFLLSPLGRWAAVAAVLGVLAGWGWLERAGRHAAQDRAHAAEKQVRARDAAIGALERQAAEAETRAARAAQIRTRIREVPNGTACAASPAVRAALDGLRAAPGPGSAGQPAGVPATPAAPRRGG